MFLSDYIQWVSEAIQSASLLAPSSLAIEIRLFVTGSTIPKSDTVSITDSSKMESPGAGSSSNDAPHSPMQISGLKTTLGRPPLAEILKQEAEQTPCGTMCVAGTFISSCLEDSLIFTVTK